VAPFLRIRTATLIKTATAPAASSTAVAQVDERPADRPTDPQAGCRPSEAHGCGARIREFSG